MDLKELALIAFAVLLGIVCTATATVSIVRSRRARRWPVVAGRVIQAKVVRRTEGDSSTIGGYVLYRYEIGGKTYRNDRQNFFIPSTEPNSFLDRDVGHLRPALQRELSGKYVKGATIGVHVNPENPSDSVLETDVHPSVFIGIALGIVCFGLAALALLDASLDP